MKTLRWTCSVALGIATATVVVPAQGQVPMPKGQAPGFFRMMIGDFEVTALNDGVVDYPLKSVVPTATPEQVAKGLLENGLTDPVGMSYNAFLVNTGAKLVLIDTGTGGKLADSPGFRGCGRLLANLRAAGYRPEQVDEIYITHLGPDHIGGLTTGPKATFPRARVRAARAEVAVFLEQGKLQPFDSVWRAFRAGLFEPYIATGRFQAFEADTELVAGIRAVATKGHTPGHTSYLIESKGQKLLVLGDLVHAAALQFRYPAYPIPFDADRTAASAERARIFRLAAEQDYWVAGSHLSFPGIGHIRAEDGQFRWAPVNYLIP